MLRVWYLCFVWSLWNLIGVSTASTHKEPSNFEAMELFWAFNHSASKLCVGLCWGPWRPRASLEACHLHTDTSMFNTCSRIMPQSHPTMAQYDFRRPYYMTGCFCINQIPGPKRALYDAWMGQDWMMAAHVNDCVHISSMCSYRTCHHEPRTKRSVEP